MAYAVGSAYVSVRPDLRGFQTKINAEVKRITDLRMRVEPELDSAAMRAQAKAAAKGAGSTVTFKAQLDQRSLKDSIVGLAALQRAVGTLAIPAAAVAVTPYLVSVASSARAAAGAANLLPAALTAGAVAAGTLVVGLSGVGDSLKATAKDSEAAAVQVIKDTEGMSTSAAQAAYAYRQLADSGQEVVDAIRGQGLAWDRLKLDVQQKLLSGVGTQITELADNYLPVLNSTLSDTADSFNGAFAMSSNFLNMPSTIDDIDYALGNVTTGLDNASGAAKPLLQVFVDLTSVGSEEMPELGQSITNVSERFRDFIAEARASGDLKIWIQDGIDTIQQLGRIGGNVFGILDSAIDAVDASGQSFLTTLENGTGKLDALLDTPEGGYQLQMFFTTTRDLVSGLADKAALLWPVVREGAGAFSALLIAGAPLAETVITLVADGLVPMLNLIEELAPALGPAIVVFGTASLAVKGYSLAMGVATVATARFAPAVIATKLVGMSTALGGAATAAGLLSPRFDSIAIASGKADLAMQKKTATMTRVVTKLGIVGVAVGVGAAAWSYFGTSTDEATAALERGGAAADQMRLSLAAQNNGQNDWLGTTLNSFIPGVKEAELALAQQRSTMDGVGRATSYAREAQGDYEQAVRQYGENSPQAVAMLATYETRQAAVAYETERAAKAEQSVTDNILERQGVMMASAEGELRYQDQLDRTTEGIARNGDTTDVNTEKGRENRQNLLDLAQGATDHLIAMQNEGVGYDVISGKAGVYEADIRRQAAEMGLTEQQTQDLIDKYYAVPPKVDTDVNAVGATETKRQVEEVDRVTRELDGKQANVFVNVWSRLKDNVSSTLFDKDGSINWMAAGGPLVGGVPGRDSIPIMGMPGEYMLSEPAVENMGGLAAVDQMHRAALRGTPMAAGGPVTAAAPAGDGGGKATADPASATVTVPLDPLASAEAVEVLTASVQNLGITGLAPLKTELLTGTVPALMQTQLEAGVKTVGAVNALAATLPPLTLGTQLSSLTMRTEWAANTAAVQASQLNQSGNYALLRNNLGIATIGMTQSIQGLQFASNASWTNIAATTGANVGQITGPIFGGLQASMDALVRGSAVMADGWTAQLFRIRAAAADPVRWTMLNPLGAPGIAASWMKLNDQFGLNKPLVMPLPGFRTGGSIRDGLIHGPGTGTSDSILAMTERGDPLKVSTGEFVVNEKTTDRHKNFLQALNAGQAEAIQAAGGRGARMPGFAAGGPIENAIDVAMSMNAKRYIWGGTGSAGTDCSGYMGFITRALRMEGNPYRRIGTTSDFPWPGFAPGLHSAFAIGNVPGSHMRGTLAGTNVEAGGSHRTSAYGGPAAGVPYGRNFHLPAAGGVFAPGGPGGGGGFDPTPIVNEAFKKTYELVDVIPQMFGTSPYVGGIQSIARQATDAVKGKGMESLAAMGGGAMNTGGVEQWRAMVIRALQHVGQPTDKALVDRVLNQIRTESGGNPRAINNWDINARNGVPSKGLLQTIDPTFQAHRDRSLPNDVYDPFANIVASMRYAMSRYGSLQAAYRGVGYDVGGTLEPGHGSYFNGTGKQERVLNPTNTRSFDTLTNMLASGKLVVHTDDDDNDLPGNGGLHYEPHFHGDNQEAAAMDALDHQMRLAERGGRGRI